MNRLSRYVETVASGSEAPRIAVAFSAIAVCGALMGREVKLEFGSSFLRGNQYIIIVGTSGTKKSSAILAAKRIAKEFNYSGFSPDIGSDIAIMRWLSKQGLDLAVNEFFGECFICQDELSNFIGTKNLKMAMWLGQMWDRYDAFNYKTESAGELELPPPYFSLLGGITPSGLVSHFSPEMIDQGFLSRTILVPVKPTARLFFLPEKIDFSAEVSDWFKVLRRPRVLTLTQSTKAYLKDLYQFYAYHPPVNHGKFSGYNNRRYIHLLKIALVLAALEDKDEIGVEECVLANTLLAFVERYYEDLVQNLSVTKDGQLAAKILEKLEISNRALTVAELVGACYNYCSDPTKLSNICYVLASAGMVNLTGGKISLVRKSRSLPKIYYPFIDRESLKPFVEPEDLAAF